MPAVAAMGWRDPWTGKHAAGANHVSYDCWGPTRVLHKVPSPKTDPEDCKDEKIKDLRLELFLHRAFEDDNLRTATEANDALKAKNDALRAELKQKAADIVGLEGLLQRRTAKINQIQLDANKLATCVADAESWREEKCTLQALFDAQLTKVQDEAEAASWDAETKLAACVSDVERRWWDENNALQARFDEACLNHADERRAHERKVAGLVKEAQKLQKMLLEAREEAREELCEEAPAKQCAANDAALPKKYTRKAKLHKFRKGSRSIAFH